MAVLEPQLTPEVEVLIFFNNFEYSLGYLRQELLDEAEGEYISHIDDDDMVPEDFVSTILPLLDGVDYIGFMVDFVDMGVKKLPVIHSLRYQSWSEDESGWYRGVTHLNPVRTELARLSSFPASRNTGEDEKWAIGMKDKCKTEHFIDREMYSYLHNGHESVAYEEKPHDTPHRVDFKSPYIRYHPRSTKNANN